MTQDEFLEKYNISTEDFKESECDFDLLLEIMNDYSKKFQRYDDAGANLVRILLRFDGVHSVKYRIKDPEHLIEKIVRKKIKDKKLVINVDNYQEKIQDLIGIRILHLFKSDWILIHDVILKNFKQVEKPEANIRKGDSEILYKGSGCKIKIHPAGYRSVHYLLKTEPTLKIYIAEIQVRTIFEEAWSEIDHKVRYPYFTDNVIINQYLKIFNGLSGSADEMGDFVIMLKNDAIEKKRNIDELDKLKQEIEKSSLPKSKKDDLSKSVETIKFNTSSNGAAYKSISEILTSQTSALNVAKSISEIIASQNSFLNATKGYKGISEIIASQNSFLNATKGYKGISEILAAQNSILGATKVHKSISEIMTAQTNALNVAKGSKTTPETLNSQNSLIKNLNSSKRISSEDSSKDVIKPLPSVIKKKKDK